MAFKFSVVMAVFNKQDYIAEALDSIINQSYGFKNNIQIVIVDDKSTDATLSILNDYRERYPQNIILKVNDKNMGPAYSRNRGLEYAEGEYVNFLDSDDIISEHAFKHAEYFLRHNPEVDIVSIPIYYFGVKRGPHNLNFKFAKDQVVDLNEKPNHIQLSGPSSFIRLEKLRNYSFNNNLKVSEDALLINQMLLDNPQIGFLANDAYHYRKDGSYDSLITSSATQKTYFTKRIEEYFFKLIDYSESEGKVPKFIQYVLMYDLQWIVEIRKISNILNEDEIRTLYDNILKILSFIDEDVILHQLSIPAALKVHVILMKRHGWSYLEDKANVEDNFKLNSLFIDNFIFKNENQIYIDGILTNFTKDTKIIAVVDGEEIRTETVIYPQRDNLSLDFSYGFNHCFKVTLNYRTNTWIHFKSQYNELNIEYNQTSRLNEISKFKVSKNNFAVVNGNEILITQKGFFKALGLEFNTLKSMFKNRGSGFTTGMFLRIAYLVCYYIFKNRHIWIFMDLPSVAGDNGLELFRYAVSQKNSKIRPYFVLEKSFEDEYEYLVASKGHKLKRLLGFAKPSEQYMQVKKIGKVLPYRSIKHRLYTLFSEFIITSHPDNTIIYPFWGNYKYVSGLAKSKTVFLQHGVTKDNVSAWLNGFDKPLALISTVSEREAESFTNPEYGYSPGIVQTLGFSRFDRLEDDAHKEIVLMPSWRRYLDQLSASEFVKSNFYRMFNDVLSDAEMISHLKDEGYKLIFKPHRNLHKFIDSFTHHPDVEFDLDLTNYSETFNRSCLVITDYSSIAFDFAYLKKPLIYYQFDGKYHFDVENAYFSYEDDGFGPVCRTSDDLKSNILKIVERGCQMDEKYAKRVDEFFKYRDRDNSKRVYEAILELDTYY